MLRRGCRQALPPQAGGDRPGQEHLGQCGEREAQHAEDLQDGQQVRVARYRETPSGFTDRKIIIEDIPATYLHAGCRLRFGPDGKLYITTGDATNRELAQQLDSSDSVLRAPARDPENHLHDQRHRVAEHVAAQSDESGRLVSNDEAVFKLLYLALRNIAKKWTLPIRDWKAALNRFAIIYENRLPAS